ncbi:putative galactinol--sucrose galactosyltransferase 6 [Apostasia shenzhenica]|uniref:galactinol--sucrose galactosyltransferase n=1 Tax=Apostasia shenzhenica TaxID=1088818 RepID=A0A2I0AQV7_9ASPA|nr:putative galactinol--sucrose galactosyltransferase 6 [Apostasia shenzhenica]
MGIIAAGSSTLPSLLHISSINSPAFPPLFCRSVRFIPSSIARRPLVKVSMHTSLKIHRHRNVFLTVGGGFFQGRSITLLLGVEKAAGERSGKMTISPSVEVSERNLVVKGRTVLSAVPDYVISSSAVSSGPVEGVFLGANLSEPSCRHVFPLGSLSDVRFMACFRFKLWWMAQRMGNRGSEVPFETQFLLVESRGLDPEIGETVYTVFLPIIEGSFRASLQGNPRDQLEICIESGDVEIRAASFSHAVFVGAAASDPFAAVSGGVLAVRSYLKTFRLRGEKRLPGIVDCFGWCTWDAFYQEITQEGVETGLRSLIYGGAPPKFIIIDDGWQSVGSDSADSSSAPANTLLRLTGIKENSKFQSKENPSAGIESIVSIAKKKYGLKYVYVWHALAGYWGGVRPTARGMEEYDSMIQFPKISPGVIENEPWMKTDVLTLQGLGLMNPKTVHKFYDELHQYLAASGVDGVKVDVQSILETLGAGHGGRVELARHYHHALDASIAKNFPDNGCIACMSHHSDGLYCEKQTAVVRASDDFYPRDPISHTIHIASVAYNSVFLGEFMLPDWDMFHSLHPAGEYHASSRAISGGPVYVSDAPGKHNFELLRKLVLPDGSILRARLPGRPTVDCLFTDPTRDGKSLLKIWNMNKFTGVLGIYNCQGAAWSSSEKKNIFHQHINSVALTTNVRGSDVHLISEAAMEQNWNGDCAFYCHGTGEVIIVPGESALLVSLKTLEHEVFTVSPIRNSMQVLAPGFWFATLGLLDMYNGGGAIDGLTYEVLGDDAELLELDSTLVNDLNELPLQKAHSRSFEVGNVCLEVKGCGRLGFYSSAEPRRCLLEAEPVEFDFDASSGLLILQLESLPLGGHKVHRVVVEL